MTTNTLPQAEPEAKSDTLTAHDRCDVCSAQAYVEANLMSGVLSFCGHHWKANEAKITPSAISIKDERWKLSGERLDVSP